MFKNRRTTLERIDKFISKEYFTDVNLYGRLYSETSPLKSLLSYSCGQERLPFADICKNSKNFKPTSVGKQFGPTWSTHWFKVEIEVPEKWLTKQVHFRWDSDSEALLWSEDGTPLFGFSGDKSDKIDYVLSRNLKEDQREQTFFVEMACNHRSGIGSPTLISPPVPNKTFCLKKAEIAVSNTKVSNILQSLQMMFDVAEGLTESNPRSFDALYAGNEIINIIQKDYSDNSILQAQAIADKFFSQTNGQSQHEIIAVGHCHIDCAWLWPYAETIRKCARSWASVIHLMETYPDYTFACSQAQQFDWVKQNYPKLFDKIKLHVARGKFIPVGGTWIEMDGNIPSGESFIRQFLYGQRFFKEEFGSYCSEFWLPDTFGYSAQLPQVIKHMGMTRFLTQKISWNLVNKFPHHNFIWEGLDGSTVTVHFPPGDSYEMEIKVKDALKTVSNLMDKGRVSKSMLLFGHGDGGGGPTEAMLQRQMLLKDVDGIPKIRHGTPTELFEHLEDNQSKLCRWTGELFLELHNATYTTQADMKKLNRLCEILLHNIEYIYCLLKALNSEDYPKAKIEKLWKIVLLNQFHDVLPGTSIAVVHKEAKELFHQVLKDGKELLDIALHKLFGPEKTSNKYLVINTLSWLRQDIIKLPNGSNVLVSSPSMGISFVKKVRMEPNRTVKVAKLGHAKLGHAYIMENKFISAIINNKGEVTSLRLLETDEEYIATPLVGNSYVLFDDVPLYWDAWDVMDYHLETKRPFLQAEGTVEILSDDCSTSGSLVFNFPYSNEHFLKLSIIIDSVHPYLQFDVQISWGPIHKFLKVEFPVSVHAQQATYEMQFGHLQRPTHYNTSWDWAKFEVCGHKWMDLSEYGKGVAILNDCKYGHSVHQNIMTLSLLRSPTNPDPTTDQQVHKFKYAIMPHKGNFQEAGVIQQAYEFNNPILLVHVQQSNFLSPGDTSRSFFEVNKTSVIIESVKMSENQPSSIVLRLYEAFGGHCQACISTSLNISRASICNGLEDVVTDVICSDGKVSLSFGPFQIISLLFCLK